MHFPSRLDGCITGKIGRFDFVNLLRNKIFTLSCTHYQGEQNFIGCLVCKYAFWSVQCQGVLVQVDHDQTWTRFILCVNGRKKVFGGGDPKKFDVPQEVEYRER